MLPPRLRVGAATARTSVAAALPAAACSTTSAEPPRVEVGLGGCIVASGAPAQPRPPRARSRESPVGGGRPNMGHTATHSQVLQAGLPVPAYEASVVSLYIIIITKRRRLVNRCKLCVCIYEMLLFVLVGVCLLGACLNACYYYHQGFAVSYYYKHGGATTDVLVIITPMLV
jgi:hypothetical protein